MSLLRLRDRKPCVDDARPVCVSHHTTRIRFQQVNRFEPAKRKSISHREIAEHRVHRALKQLTLTKAPAAALPTNRARCINSGVCFDFARSRLKFHSPPPSRHQPRCSAAPRMPLLSEFNIALFDIRWPSDDDDDGSRLCGRDVLSYFRHSI